MGRAFARVATQMRQMASLLTDAAQARGPCLDYGGKSGSGYSLLHEQVSPCNSEVHSSPAYRRNSHPLPLSGLTFRRLLALFTVFLYSYFNSGHYKRKADFVKTSAYFGSIQKKSDGAGAVKLPYPAVRLVGPNWGLPGALLICCDDPEDGCPSVLQFRCY